MKPIKLTMKAFGPYKNVEVIDFNELKDNRLFVISGSTGAGKTTIFDGISFALYGFGSGQDRKETKTLRSDFAEDTVHTAVELVFEIHGRTYRVLRQLSHVKEGRKTATGEKYELFEIQVDGQEAAIVERQRVTDINQKIEELIGLSYDQFNQIVMLPQGEFRKLLTSQSDNKEEILRKIFKTNRYGEMAQKLEEKKRKAEMELDRARTLKNSYISQIEGALPKRDSFLFAVLAQESNVYQIQDALDEEVKFYREKIKEDRKHYEEARIKHDDQYNRFIQDKAINDRIDNYQQRKQKLQELEQQKPTYEQMKSDYEAAIRASKIQPLNQQCHALHKEKVDKQNHLENATQRLELAKNDLAEATRVFEIESSKQIEREQASQQLNDLQKLLPRYEQIELLSKKVESLKIAEKEAHNALANIEKQLNGEKEKVDQLHQLIEQLEEKKGNFNEYLEQQTKLKQIINLFSLYNQLKHELQGLQMNVNTSEKEYQSAKQLYDLEEGKWLTNQASILASSLVPGAPCPVCGSTEHKQITSEHTVSVDETTIKNLKARLAEAEQKKYRAEAKMSAHAAQVTQCEQELEKFSAPLEKEQEITGQYNELNLKIEQIKKDDAKLVAYKKNLKQLKSMLEQLESEQKQLVDKHYHMKEQLLRESTVLTEQQKEIPSNLQHISQLHKAIADAEKHKLALFTQWEKVQKHLHDVEKYVAATEEAVNQTTKQIEHLEEKLVLAKEEFKRSMAEAGFESYRHFESSLRDDFQITHLQNQYMEFSKVLHTITAQVQQESEELEGKEKVDLSLMEEGLNTLKFEYENALQIMNRTLQYESQAIDFSEKLDQVADKIYQLEEISSQIIDLHNLLRGQNSKKISFERYVQMGYLEQITEAANIRLKNLSNGQYYLQCSDRQESHGRQSGLSLDVYDTYTGQSRDVKSLSGGEKFNASLCLALGMADVIQSFQGNVKIDTMFIDEGFGSLDEESLMKAIDTLIDLQKSGRMIGVISHVSELKAAIPAILQVEKLKEGYSQTSILLK
ncbi:AAA family ATPase [Ureibacillus aquaedulcis]|uniref:Nuclease SbcCD subunit C n=1 Tax=Ureibacillus aquaedulcis TaxID=3058421 RepID=A0ABT8GUG3_9BACL|nr:SMC family ATPase [Ureibacillus sp. BA0131]MDN4495058.1 SMC family ATPase [Ureibacillus sp. BA0131]